MATEVITVREAAAKLGRSPATIEEALRDGTFPVGSCYKRKGKKARFTYIIPAEAFNRFMRGDLAGRRLSETE